MSAFTRMMVSTAALAIASVSVLGADQISIKGKVSFEGAVPKPRKVADLADAHCKKTHPQGLETQTVKVKDGALADVFVQIKSGLPKDQKWEVPKGEDGKPKPVVLDQKGCEYAPHVFGIMVGQPLKVTNSDPTQHNIHGHPRANPAFNFSQSQKGMEKLVETLTKPERFPIRCDVHAWMNAHAFVMPHPFFAVSGEDGSFEIKDLPPGTYEVEFWHESLGTKTVKDVKVEAGKPAKAEVTFTPKKRSPAVK